MAFAKLERQPSISPRSHDLFPPRHYQMRLFQGFTRSKIGAGFAHPAHVNLKLDFTTR